MAAPLSFMQKCTCLSCRCQNEQIDCKTANKLQQVSNLTNMKSMNNEDRVYVVAISSRFCGRSAPDSFADAKMDGG